MKDRLQYLPWFPRDFMSSTRGWKVTEKGVYRELLDAQWDLGTLPTDPAELQRLIGADDAEWSAGWRRCESKFPVVGDGRRNSRLESHRAISLETKERRRSGAEITNAKRWGSKSDSESQSDRSAIAQRVAQRSPPTPTPTEEKNKNPASPAVDSGSEDQDPDDFLIWTAGIELLGESKRGLMGKLVKTHGRDLVARKLGELMAMPEKPRDPAAYFVGVMRKFERRFQA